MNVFSPLDAKQLIKVSSDQTIETVVLVGNGALQNGWLPLRRVLDEWIDKDPLCAPIIKKLRGQNSESLHQLGSLSYRFKIARGLIYKNWSTNEFTPAQTEKAGLGQAITEFLNLREAIGSEYQKHSPSLLNHDWLDEGLDPTKTVFITTNWENVLWQDKTIQNVIYLHGRCDHPDSLVFPTELIIEDIAYDCERILEKMKGRGSEFTKMILRTFRCETVNALLEAHSKASRLIHQAKKIIIWGYSLGDFDADINALIGPNVNREEERELIVINTNPYAFQRAVALTGLTHATHYNPILGSTLKLDA